MNTSTHNKPRARHLPNAESLPASVARVANQQRSTSTVIRDRTASRTSNISATAKRRAAYLVFGELGGKRYGVNELQELIASSDPLKLELLVVHYSDGRSLQPFRISSHAAGVVNRHPRDGLPLD